MSYVIFLVIQNEYGQHFDRGLMASFTLNHTSTKPSMLDQPITTILSDRIYMLTKKNIIHSCCL